MSAALSLLWTTIVLTVPALATTFSQVAPEPRPRAPFLRSRPRAVVLIHGLRVHPFRNSRVAQADAHFWQRSDSLLVQTLGKESDVFIFCYSQNIPLERVAESPDLAGYVRQLRDLGYAEIVLVGHSAGGLIARHFVEDYPYAGVTKVIQVCAPNGGCSLARATLSVRESQEVFLGSLTRQGRQRCLDDRPCCPVPSHVEFVCVVGQLGLQMEGMAAEKILGGKVAARLTSPRIRSDGVVSARCQWPEDLQEQGIPAVDVSAGHFLIMGSQGGVDTIARLVRDKQPRWDAERVAAARRRLLGADADDD